MFYCYTFFWSSVYLFITNSKQTTTGHWHPWMIQNSPIISGVLCTLSHVYSHWWSHKSTFVFAFLQRNGGIALLTQLSFKKTQQNYWKNWFDLYTKVKLNTYKILNNNNFLCQQLKNHFPINCGPTLLVKWLVNVKNIHLFLGENDGNMIELFFLILK